MQKEDTFVNIECYAFLIACFGFVVFNNKEVRVRFLRNVLEKESCENAQNSYPVQ